MSKPPPSLLSPHQPPVLPLCTFYVTNPDLPSPNTKAPLRDIIYINDILSGSNEDPTIGEMLFRLHTGLYISSTATDGPLKIEIAGDESFSGIIRAIRKKSSLRARAA